MSFAWPTPDDLIASPYVARAVTDFELDALTGALDAARSAIVNFTGQVFEPVEDDIVVLLARGQDYRGRSGSLLFLPQLPVTAVTSVVVDGVVVPPTSYSWFGPTGELRRIDGFAWRSPSVRAWAPTQVTVTHNHGYDTLPDDARSVCLTVAGRIFNNPQRTIQQSESIGNYSETNEFGPRALPLAMLADDEKAQLERYRPLVAA